MAEALFYQVKVMRKTSFHAVICRLKVMCGLDGMRKDMGERCALNAFSLKCTRLNKPFYCILP